MSRTGLSYGLNITKKQPFASRPPPSKLKPIFDEDDGSDGDENQGREAVVEEIGELEAPEPSSKSDSFQKSSIKSKSRVGAATKPPLHQYGDLSSSLTSKKHASTAEELDPNIYDYDAIYDTLKPQKNITAEDKERKPKYMGNLLAAAALRKRDAAIAEEKKLAREREAEGEEFADKEKFVTFAYKKQQEENRRLEEEERLREEADVKKNKGAGMTSFFKSVLEKGEQKHAQIMKAAEERSKAGPGGGGGDDPKDAEEEHPKTEAELAKEINDKRAGAIVLNDEGQVVDKRQLLKGGLNILPKPKPHPSPSTSSHNNHHSSSSSSRPHSGPLGALPSSKQAMRERQSRMLEAQLEAATKRALEDEDAEREKVERAAKSRKTEGEIVGARERYLARKREMEEAKRKGDGASSSS